jgi:hypothetical protein
MSGITGSGVNGQSADSAGGVVSVTATAPDAPGRLGQAIPADNVLVYLRDLGLWRDRRRAELDRLDEAALATPRPDAYSRDVMLAMSLWKAVADRYDELERVWDSGRVGKSEREKLSQLIWGRLDIGAGISLPEACRLSDATAVQLSHRLSLDPMAANVGARLRAARAGIERIRDLVQVEPPQSAPAAAKRLGNLDERCVDVWARAQRGADVAGLLATLESDAAHTERDLIVAGAKRRDDARDLARAHRLRAALETRETALRDLEARAVATVRPAPRLAVPDVDALGAVPAAPEDVDAYLLKLGRVGQALDYAEKAYTFAVSEPQELLGRLQAYRAKARATGHAEDAELDGIYQRAAAALRAVPADIVVARAGVAEYQAKLAASSVPTQQAGSGA